ALLDEVRAGLVATIYVDELSRLSRVLEDVLRVQRLLRFHGVSLWAVHENIDITDDRADLQVVFAGQKSQEASRDARHRVRRSMDGNLLRGLSNGDLTLGYRSVELTEDEIKQRGLPPRGKDHRPYRRLMIHVDEAEIVRMILRLFAVEKMTIRAITRHLNAKEVPRGGKARTERWLPIDVRKILSSRRYLGFRWRNRTMILVNPDTGGKTWRPQPKSEWIDVHDPSLAILDQSTFDAAQRRLAENKAVYGQRRNGNGPRSGLLMSYAPRKLLSGALIYGECEAALVQKHRRGVAYYVCPNAQCGLCSNTVQTRCDLVHELVLDAVRDEAEPMFLADRVHELMVQQLETMEKDLSYDISKLQHKLLEVAGEISNLTAALAKRPDSTALYDALDNREAERDRLETEIREATHRTKVPTGPPSVEWVCTHLQDALPELLEDNVSRAAHLIRAITGPIRVFPRQKPWLKTRYPVVRFTLDLSRMVTAIAADRAECSESSMECGFGVEVEFEVRKVPLYEKYAAEVVRLHDDNGLGWREIARRLPEKISPDYVAKAYEFGKTGDLYGHAAAGAGGDVPGEA
ncbi:MAG TPA: recombinase family protein, partial [Phycisphaerae bacterium]|nr:recombinase family protein [Phycisphaerae bacterium]